MKILLLAALVGAAFSFRTQNKLHTSSHHRLQVKDAEDLLGGKNYSKLLRKALGH